MIKSFFLLSLVSILAFPALVSVKETKQIRVAILDTGLDLEDTRFKGKLCPGESRDFTDTEIKDHHGHGTHVASVIAHSQNKDVCLIIVKFWLKENTDHENNINYDNALQYIKEIHPDIVNMSLSGEEPGEVEENVVASLSDTIFVVAAGNNNDSEKVIKHYPAALTLQYNNVIVVGSLDENERKAPSSNYDYPNMKWVRGVNVRGYAIGSGYLLMTGTSQAASVYTMHLLNTFHK